HIFDHITRSVSALEHDITTGDGSNEIAALPGGKLWVAGSIYDPTTSSFHWGHGSGGPVVRLSTGDILEMGRLPCRIQMPDDEEVLCSSNLIGRHRPQATRLGSGRVLLTGGDDDNGLPLSSADLMDAGDDVVTGIGALAQGRRLHVATPLSSGDVLFLG